MMQRCWHKTELTCHGVERLPTAAKHLQSGAQCKARFALPRTCRKRYMLHKHACLHAPVHRRARAHTHTHTHTHTQLIVAFASYISGPAGQGIETFHDMPRIRIRELHLNRWQPAKE